MNINNRETRRHWSNLEERGVYLGQKIMLKTYHYLGRSVFSLFLFPVIFYFYLTNRSARRASVEYLARISLYRKGLENLGPCPPRLRSFWHFFCFGEAILDKFRAWTGKLHLEDIDFINHEVVAKLQESNQGALLIASHLGNAEVSRALGMRQKGLKITVLVHTKNAKKFHRLMCEQSKDSTLSVIQVTEIGPSTAIFLSQKILDGEFVVIVGDRTSVGFNSRVVWVPFLGRRAPFPQGPCILAAVLKCPVLLLFCMKKNNRFRVIIEPFCDLLEMSRSSRGAVLNNFVTRYAKRLEYHCFDYPYQWFNFFDFWYESSRAPTHKDTQKQ